jgi:threonine synthase
MWKAFAEMEELGWIGSGRPKMIAVQAEGCQPVVRAWEAGADRSEFFGGAATVASGLRVPKPLGDALMLRAIRESGGCAVAVSDAEMLDAGIEMAEAEGIFGAPEGGACVAAVRTLIQRGTLTGDDRIVVYNTGTGLKYLEAYSTRFIRNAGGEADKLGGLITPR